MPEQQVNVGSLHGVLHTWLECDIEALEFELPSGKMATELSITGEAAAFQACEKYGEGFEPYANSPDAHQEMLQSEDVAETDGVVEYLIEGGAVELPKFIYFEQRVQFSEPITATTPEAIAERLQEELNAIGGIDKDIEVTAPESL